MSNAISSIAEQCEAVTCVQLEHFSRQLVGAVHTLETSDEVSLRAWNDFSTDPQFGPELCYIMERCFRRDVFNCPRRRVLKNAVRSVRVSRYHKDLRTLVPFVCKNPAAFLMVTNCSTNYRWLAEELWVLRPGSKVRSCGGLGCAIVSARGISGEAQPTGHDASLEWNNRMASDTAPSKRDELWNRLVRLTLGQKEAGVEPSHWRLHIEIIKPPAGSTF